MDFTHYQSSKLLGPSSPNKHGVVTAFWASPSHITAAFWASPGTLPGCPNPQCFGHPLQKMLDFAGKSKTFQRWLPLNIEMFSSILKRRLIRKALQSKTKRLCENLPKSSSMTQNQSPCFTWPRRRMAQCVEERHSAPLGKTFLRISLIRNIPLT